MPLRPPGLSMNAPPLDKYGCRLEDKSNLKLLGLDKQATLSSQTPKGAALSKFIDNVSTTAFHNSDARIDRCYPGTRTQLLADLDKWASRNVLEWENSNIFWLSGTAGSGKTTIMHTFAERASERVAASFFFFRSDARRNSTEYLLPTLLYQLSCFVPPPQRSRILASASLFPLVRHRSLPEQFDTLVLNPLRDLFESGDFGNADSRRLIIIDGLDECIDQANQLEVVDMLFQAVKARMPFLFLLSSRPDAHLQRAFSAQNFDSPICRRGLDDTSQNDLDIRMFLQQRIHECQTIHPFRRYSPPNWPSDKDIDCLADKSSRLFIFASTAMRFIECPRDIPATRLTTVLELHADDNQPYAQLDALYAHILQTASSSAQLLRIFALIALSNNRLPVSSVASILQIPVVECERALMEIPSLVSLCNQHKSSYINVCHTSLLDFIRDPNRSQAYGICVSDHNAQIIQASTHFIIFSNFNAASLSVLNIPFSTASNDLEPLEQIVCAEAAIVCLGYLSESSPHVKSLLESRQFGYSCLHNCWTAHQRALKKSIPSRKTLITPFALVPHAVWKIQGNTTGQYHSWMTYRMVLIYLAYFLARAAMSNELFQMCQSQTFSPISMQFPNYSQNARRAMNAYVVQWSTPA